MKSVHEVLVAGRNGAATDEGYDVASYGTWENDDCGTPRCMLGWCAWESGVRIPRSEPAFFLQNVGDSRLPATYIGAVEALWETRPFDPPFVDGDTLGEVEEVAWELQSRCGGNRDEERRVVLDWFARAISFTAPAPQDPFDRGDTERISSAERKRGLAHVGS